mmetsp:Transcript_49420/g.77046  ORF Transcript_49420/g.77046 Transcript_49420/m.77046 type:complete len:199 (-) Transcript_49420:176-772(-)
MDREKLQSHSQSTYLPFPQEFISNRRGQAGFSVYDNKLCQEVGNQRRIFRSYGEWWQAQQKPPPPVETTVARHVAISTTYWPYGHGVTTLTGAMNQGAGYRYLLDDRPVDNVIPNGAHRIRASSSLTARRFGGPHIRTAGSAISSTERASLSPSQSMPSLQRAQRTNSFAAVDVVDRSQKHTLLGSNAEAIRFSAQRQ